MNHRTGPTVEGIKKWVVISCFRREHLLQPALHRTFGGPSFVPLKLALIFPPFDGVPKQVLDLGAFVSELP